MQICKTGLKDQARSRTPLKVVWPDENWPSMCIPCGCLNAHLIKLNVNVDVDVDIQCGFVDKCGQAYRAANRMALYWLGGGMIPIQGLWVGADAGHFRQLQTNDTWVLKTYKETVDCLRQSDVGFASNDDLKDVHKSSSCFAEMQGCYLRQSGS